MSDETLQRLTEALNRAAEGDFAPLPADLMSNSPLSSLAKSAQALIDSARARHDTSQDIEARLEAIHGDYQRLRANVPGIIYVYMLHADGRESISYISDAVRDLLNLDPAEVMKDAAALTSLLHPQDREALYASVQESATTLQPWRHEFRYIVDGVIRWFDGMARPTAKPNGDTVWYGILLETTARRQAEQAMRESEARYRELHESMMDAYARTDMEGWFLESNAAFQTLVGYTPEELEQLRYQDLTPIDWHAGDSQAVNEQVRTRGYTDVFEKEFQRKDGTRVPVELRVYALRDETGAPKDMCAIVRDITARKAMEETLRITQDCVDKAAIAIFRVDEDGRFLYANDQACDSLGYTRNELLSRSVWDIDTGFNREEWLEHRRDVQSRGSGQIERIVRRKDGGTFPVEITITYFQREGRDYSFTFMSDISERHEAEKQKRRLEEQLLQAQKLESVGRLAGGIAHDFNNMLAVILGYTELIKDRLSQSDPILADIREIQKAGEHSREITSQLLAFSRKQLITPVSVDLNDLVLQTNKTLSRLLGDDIELQVRVDADICPVHVDPHQIEQILMNLGVNARDAMTDGGVLRIESQNVTVADRGTPEGDEIPAGNYVLLRVTDTGHGMDAETLAHVFEPFFTTKDVDKGTGLGLATVYGIVKQNHGHIFVESEVGHGATFRIYFPRRTSSPQPIERPIGETVTEGRGTVLVVEDEEMVRKITERMLRAAGYDVLVASGPADAIAVCKQTTQSIDLLVTDVTMPDMNGAQLAAQLRTMLPGLPVLFMSGYGEHILANGESIDHNMHFIQKPFNMETFTRQVRDAMSAEG